MPHTATHKEEPVKKDNFVTKNDPFELGRQATQREFQNLLKANANRRATAEREFSGLKTDLDRSNFRNFKGAVEGARGLSGGQLAQRGSELSAREGTALGNLRALRESALRDIDLERDTAFGRAQQAGRQAQEFGFQDRDRRISDILSSQDVLSGKGSFEGLSKEERARIARLLGVDESEVEERLLGSQRGGGAISSGIKGNILEPFIKEFGLPGRGAGARVVGEGAGNIQDRLEPGARRSADSLVSQILRLLGGQ